MANSNRALAILSKVEDLLGELVGAIRSLDVPAAPCPIRAPLHASPSPAPTRLSGPDIAVIRKRLGLSQMDLARRLGFKGKTPNVTISKWETGRIIVPVSYMDMLRTMQLEHPKLGPVPPGTMQRTVPLPRGGDDDNEVCHCRHRRVRHDIGKWSCLDCPAGARCNFFRLARR
jgi:DNA-binding transcriptional regulator YiaG